MGFSMKTKITTGLSVAAVLLAVVGQAHAFQSTSMLHHTPYQISESFIEAADQNAEQGAQNFIGGMTDRALGFLANSDLSHEQRKKEFRSLLNSSFDMDTIARFTIGRYWREASPAQQKEYLKLFKEMIVEVYSRRFEEYNGQGVEVVGSSSKSETDVIVNSKIVQNGGGPDVKLDWRVRYKNGQYKIVDVIVEGVSMAVTQRSDFSSVIQRGGGDIGVLLAHLKER